MSGPPTERFVEANGLLHHVLCWDGGGEAVVLCHGYLDLAWSWGPVAERLADAGLRVFAFDFRGHGETQWVGRGGYYHFADYLMDLEHLLPQLDPEGAKVHLVGHSMGSTVCAMFGGVRSSRLRSVTLVEGLGPPELGFEHAAEKYALWLDTVAKVRARHRPRAMRDLDDALRRLRVQHPDLPEALGRFLAEKATRPSDDGTGLVFRFDPLHQTTSPSPFRREVFASFTRSIEVPTLVVMGEEGFRLPDKDERRSALPPHGFAEVPGVGHMIHWHAPDALAELIAAHCRTSAK